jgi:hypothetical protein
MERAKFRCPECGFKENISIPKKSCLQFHECKKCGKMISSPKGVCCIICAYTDKKCPVPGIVG